jgi:hypothetical protein
MPSDTSPVPEFQLVDAKADLDAAQAATANGAIRHYTRPSDTNAYISSGKDGSTGSPGFGYTTGRYFSGFELTQTVATFIGTGLEGQKDYPYSFFYNLALGVDYIGIPGSNAQIEWESESAELTGWADWNVDIGRVSAGSFTYNAGHGSQFHSYGNTLVPLPGFTAPTFRYQAFGAELVGANENDVASIAFQPYGAGVNVGEFTPAMDPMVTADQPISGNTTLTLSEVGPAPILSVMVQSDYQGPLAQPIANYTVHDAPDNDANDGSTLQAGSQIFIRITFWGIEQAARLINGVTTQLYPKVIYRNPRWRYWIPGPTPAYIPLPLPPVGALTINDAQRSKIIFKR